ncbi:TPA: hypothetical protein DIC39_02115 [Patescibacteria group bacterium]|nr:hypothetical protein [Patescibacteria group bacterium]HCU47832.1 hypothetical protein [Patescibacteria group bacterium]
MFREYPTIDQGDLATEVAGHYEGKEQAPKSLELDEDLFTNLETAADKLPVMEGKFYKAQLAETRRFAFEDVERLFNILSSSPDTSRAKILEKGHSGLRSIADIGLRLREAGVEVPWLNPNWEEVLDQVRRGEINEPIQVSPFRSIVDEQMLELIARHDALQAALNVKSGQGRRLNKFTPEQAESVSHIQTGFKRLSSRDQNEFTRLISDDDFYHQSLENLKLRQSRRAQESQNKLVA